jgi:hypothetical protein
LNNLKKKEQVHFLKEMLNSTGVSDKNILIFMSA